ncbi:YHS domain-containing (seleno)protein [Flagellimonas flava]|uniref:YHS domain-containing (seleno)protein n=1 Tax=Flagellimonas flava TaxID=570519 RepID=UPI003D65BF71
MKKGVKITLISVVILLGLIFTFAKVKRVTPLSWGHKQVNQPMFSNEAINGYDPVAYFKENKAVPGNEAITYQWNHADWSFSSEENKALFAENPEKYAPQYGGFCAFAVSKGFTANSNPNTYEILDGKLYLFDSEDIKADWKANSEESLRKGDTNWE